MARCTFFGIALCLIGYGCGGGRGAPPGPDGSFYKFDGGLPEGGPRRDGGQMGGGRSGRSGGTAGVGTGGSSAGSGTPVPVAGAAAIGGSSGVAGTSGPIGGMNGRPPTFCDSEGYCLYPGGLLCYPDGPCCYPDMATGQCCTANGCRPVPPWIGRTPTEPPPEPKPWVPPLPEDDVGEPGWRDSEEPLCTRRTLNFMPYMSSIWSDSRGVFVAAQVETQYDPMNPNSCGGCLRDAVFFNDGTGWDEVEGVSEEDQYSFHEGAQLLITGFDNGPLVLYGYSFNPSGVPCGLSTVSDGKRTCYPVDGVFDVQVVNDTLAYGLLQGRLIRYDGTNWGPLPISGQIPEMQFLWADETTVMATAYGPGTIYTLKNGMFSVEDTRTLESFSTIFGFGPDDVWAGTFQGGLYHYDGMTWSPVDWARPDCEGDTITGMWGVNGVLYFITMTTVQKWNGTEVEQITAIEGDCRTAVGPRAFTAIWGSAENEVYVSMFDASQPDNECGSGFLLYYDGSKFHQM